MGTKKGQRRKTARRAFESGPYKSRPGEPVPGNIEFQKTMHELKMGQLESAIDIMGRWPKYPDDPDSPEGKMAMKSSIADMLFREGEFKKGKKKLWKD